MKVICAVARQGVQETPLHYFTSRKAAEHWVDNKWVSPAELDAITYEEMDIKLTPGFLCQLLNRLIASVKGDVWAGVPTGKTWQLTKDNQLKLFTER